MLKSILLLFAIVGFGQQVCAQSRITTVTGATYSGRILNEDSREVLIRTTDSLDITIPRDKIESVSYGKVTRSVTAPTPHSAEAEPIQWQPAPIMSEPEEPHWAAGLALGTPAALQPVVAYYSGEWGVRGSAMMYPETVVGLQVGLMKRILKSGELDVNAALISGFSVLEGDRSNFYNDEMWVYAGPALSLDLFGIFAEGGLTLGIGDFSNPQLMFQLGYAYHFR